MPDASMELEAAVNVLIEHITADGDVPPPPTLAADFVRALSNVAARRQASANGAPKRNYTRDVDAPGTWTCGMCSVTMYPNQLGYAAKRRAREGKPVFCSKRCSGAHNANKRWHREQEVS